MQDTGRINYMLGGLVTFAHNNVSLRGPCHAKSLVKIVFTNVLSFSGANVMKREKLFTVMNTMHHRIKCVDVNSS